MYRFPAPSSAMAPGVFNCASVASPPSPLNPSTPVPATAARPPVAASTLRTWWRRLSLAPAMYRVPVPSSAMAPETPFTWVVMIPAACFLETGPVPSAAARQSEKPTNPSSTAAIRLPAFKAEFSRWFRWFVAVARVVARMTAMGLMVVFPFFFKWPTQPRACGHGFGGTWIPPRRTPLGNHDALLFHPPPLPSQALSRVCFIALKTQDLLTMKAATRLVIHPHPHSNRLRKRRPCVRCGGPTRVLPELLGG